MASSINPFLWNVTPSFNDIADSGIPFQEGQTPGSLNNSCRAVMAALARFIADINGTKSTGGSADAYTVVTGNLDHTALSNGLMITIRASFTNTGASTFNLNSIGAKKIRKFLNAGGTGSESDLSAGEIVLGGNYVLTYNTSAASGNGAWILLNPSYDRNGGITGEIRGFAGSVLPDGWLWCSGTVASRTTDAALFAVIGTTYGPGDGVTTFHLPDLRGRVPAGNDNMGGVGAALRLTAAGSGITGTTLGAVGGSEIHTLTVAQLPVHTPTGTVSSFTPSGSISTITPTGTVSSITPSGSVTVTINDPAHDHNGGLGSYMPNAKTGSQFAAGAGATPLISSILSTDRLAVTVNNAYTGITASASFAGNAVTPTFTGNAVTPTFTGNSITPTFTGVSIGSGSSHNNVQPTLVINYIIKR